MLELKMILFLLGLVQLSTGVLLRSGGYEGVTVAIEEDLPVSLCAEIVHGLQESLQAASTSLHTATRQRASFRHVTVLLPSSWTPAACPPILGVKRATGHSWATANLRITSNQDSQHGLRPWTQQSRGCGQQGDYISMAHHTLRQNTSLANGRLLAYEWIKYRYGVFPEVGRAGHPLHPAHFRRPDASWAPTACADRPLVSADDCDPSDPSCGLRLRQEDNQDLTSSFMAFPEMPSVSSLCDEGSHDRWAPTRHNLVCGGKSVWEVLRASEDFRDSRLARPQDSLVTLNFVSPRAKSLVFLVDDTNVMNSQKRWEYLRKALRKAVAYDVPEGVSVGLVVFDSRASVKHGLSPLIDDQIREKVGSSLPRNPSVVPETERCLICGLQKAIELLSDSQGSGSVVLVTGGSANLNSRDAQRAQQMLQNFNVDLQLITYPLLPHFSLTGNTLEGLASQTGGKTFVVPDEGIGEDSRVSMYYELLDSLYHAVGEVSGWTGLPVKIHEARHAGGIFGMSEGSFIVDIKSELRFAIFYHSVEHVGNAVHLISSLNQEIDASYLQTEDTTINMISVVLQGSQVTPGFWKYKVDNQADSHQGLHILVTSRPSQESQIKVHTWTNQAETNATLAIFAEVRTRAGAVLGASVVASIARLGPRSFFSIYLPRLGLAANGTKHTPMQIDLFDNGFLDPDMTSGDGVYSRILPQLETGKFSVSVRIEGSFGQLPFTRLVRLGVLNVRAPPQALDVIPPARIVDLRASVLPGLPSKVTFTWHPVITLTEDKPINTSSECLRRLIFRKDYCLGRIGQLL